MQGVVKKFKKYCFVLIVFSLFLSLWPSYEVRASSELTDVSASTMQSAQSEFMKYLTGYKGFNVQGVYNGSMIQTTFRDAGYQTAFQVGDGAKKDLDSFQYGKLHNKNDSAVTVKIGSSADTQVGSNDSAAISFAGDQIVMEDTSTNSRTYGAQFRVYPGEGSFTTKWFGNYSYAYDNMFNSSSESFSGDSGLAWSWTLVDIEPEGTVTKVAKLKVMKSLEILDSNLTANLEHNKVVMTVPYEDKAGLTQTLHYTIDGGDDLGGDTGDTNNSTQNSFEKNIDVSETDLNWEANSNHTIKIWLTNNNNVNSSTLTYNVFWAGDQGDVANFKTLKFNSNSGNLFADVRAGSGTVYKLPADTMNGFIFKGWSKNADGSGTLYQADTEYTIEADETLYAVFQRKITVTFDTMGGTPDFINVELVEGDKVEKPEEPSKEGYVLGGWYTDAECTSEYDFSTAVTGNKTLYAKWEIRKGDKDVSTKVESDGKSPTLKADNLADIAESTLTDGEQEKVEDAIAAGKTVDIGVYLEIKDIADSVTAADKEKIQALAADAGKIAYFDISLYKTISIDEELYGGGYTTLQIRYTA